MKHERANTASAAALRQQADTVIRAGSSSFSLASRVFDRKTRSHVRALYAWCRHCDDVIDGQLLGHGQHFVHEKAARLAALQRCSERALLGDGSDGVAFAGLAAVVTRTQLPERYVRDHLAGFAMDVEDRQYETLDDTMTYCYHVAGVVGLMMAWIMGVRDEDTLLRGCDLGIAFQLTNIARDVTDDAASGRVYLPAAWLREAGVSLRERPLSERTRHALVPSVDRLLDHADLHYASARYGLRALPPRAAWAVATARHVYADIGGVLRRRGANAWDTRAGTTRARKLGRLAQALGEAAYAVSIGSRLRIPPRLGLWTPPRGHVLP